VLQVGATLFWLGVDKADQVDPVLGMLKELSPDQLADLPRADDHRILLVCNAAAAERARGCAAERDEGDGERPEERELDDVWARKTRQPGSHDENPRADRDHVEDVPHVVDRGVVRALLIALVEAVELGDDDPCRQGSEEEHPLHRRVDRVRSVRVRSQQELGGDKCNPETEQVGGEQHASDEPSPPADRGRGAATLQDLERPVVHRRRDLVVEQCSLNESGTLGRVHEATPAVVVVTEPPVKGVDEPLGSSSDPFPPFSRAGSSSGNAER
jgi:hypothetical protein